MKKVVVVTSVVAASAAFAFWKFITREDPASDDENEEEEEEEEEEEVTGEELAEGCEDTRGDDAAAGKAFEVPEWLSRLEPMNPSSQANNQPPRKNARGRYRSVSSDAADVAQAILLDKISEQYSPAENAAHLLQDMLTRNGALNAVDRATITYAVRVLQSDSVEASIPEALQRTRSSAWKRRVSFFSQVAGGPQQLEDVEHEMAHEWLRSDFTPLGERHNGNVSHHASFSSERWNKLRNHTRSFSFHNLHAHPNDSSHSDLNLLNPPNPSNPSPRLAPPPLPQLRQELSDEEQEQEAPAPSSSSPTPSVLDLADTPALPYEASEEEEARILAALEGVNEWGWDVFSLREATGGRELQTLGWHLMRSWGLVEAFALDLGTLRRWLDYVASKYDDLPYHNSTHATDVLQTVHYMLETAQVRHYLEGIEVLAILVAAMVHDMGHDGCNNAYHKNAVTERALQFNDQSIQENFHLSTLFSAMKDTVKDINILKTFTSEEYVEIRRMIISMVLATDMSRHFVLTKEFKELAENFGSNVEMWNESHDQLMCTILHACDISNPAKPLNLAKTWANRCIAEFFRQGDMELQGGLSISPQCNRDTTFVPTSQVAFIKFVVLPTMEAIGDFLAEVAQNVLPLVQENLQYWQEQEASELQQHKDKMALLCHSPLSTSRTGSAHLIRSRPPSGGNNNETEGGKEISPGERPPELEVGGDRAGAGNGWTVSRADSTNGRFVKRGSGGSFLHDVGEVWEVQEDEEAE